ncbi:MAG: DUF1667 domain-containing protein [Synergistaceae bacterium]|nr:DUF1667 domain-containing protein [Synergistaceae bacterium]MBQ9403707.1 DUF1667 domain-containing protein [Synergistaceae bacterium]MBQ9595376.1 DUF1667 domain-containing protein [Synergistaceae bacterium]MBR0204218.1 DUF1667 domain-containing protein [Synergistaceae bacterium]
MSEERKFICVSCPLGCGLTVSLNDSGEVVKVEGNTCPRGESYARSEVKDPRRVFASTVRVKGGKLPVCPIRSKTPAPKGKLFEIAEEVAKLEVNAPLKIGQVLIHNVCGTDVDIVASRDLAAV